MKKKFDLLSFCYKVAKSVSLLLLVMGGFTWYALHMTGQPAERMAEVVPYIQLLSTALMFVAALSLSLCVVELIDKEVELRKTVQDIMEKARKEDAKKVLEGKDITPIEPSFECHGCGHILPDGFSLRTEGYCYLCDPNITVDELLSDAPIEKPLPCDGSNCIEPCDACRWNHINPMEPQECEQWCGMNYCDDNGCINRKRNLVEPYTSGIGWQDAPTAPETQNLKPETT